MVFTSDPKTKFEPVYYHEQLKFYCKSESPPDKKCGLFKWNSKEFQLYYFKIHTPTEHTFDNIKLGMELQFVMKEKGTEKKMQNTSFSPCSSTLESTHRGRSVPLTNYLASLVLILTAPRGT